MAPQGKGLQRAIGELLTCTRCVGTWSALGLVGLRTFSPPAGRAVTRVFAVGGANIIMQAAFKALAGLAEHVPA